MQFPSKALKLVQKIREQVPYPGPPHESKTCGLLCWEKQDGDECCPLGLLPDAKKGFPEHVTDFKPMTYDVDEIRAFVDWWDALGENEAERAVRLIWPRKAH